MKKSDSLENLAKALVEVQKTKLFALTDKENPFFSSKYADLSSVWSAARNPLTSNGLSIIQTMDISDSGVIIETTLLHISGEYISGRLLMTPEKATPQGIGSAITYGRRYGLAAIIGISPEDDDAESAMNRNKKIGTKSKTKTTSQTTSENDKELSQKQWDFIKSIGEKGFGLTEKEVVEFVKWTAKKHTVTPRHWKMAKLLLPKENFNTEYAFYSKDKIGEKPKDDTPFPGDFENK